jgi:hypothetical protein
MTEKMKKMSEEAAKRVAQKYPELQELLREEKSKGWKNWNTLKGIDWMVDDELMEKFIEEKSDIDDLFKAGSLREDDVCELTLKDIKNIVKYVNEEYDLNLSYVNHELIWN